MRYRSFTSKINIRRNVRKIKQTLNFHNLMMGANSITFITANNPSPRFPFKTTLKQTYEKKRNEMHLSLYENINSTERQQLSF